MVTPSGIEILTRKSYRYFKRTIKNMVYYKEIIENLTAEVKSKGYEGLLLKGASDLDFIVEYACRRQGLKYVKDDNFQGKTFLLYSENYLPDKEERQEGSVFLQSLLM